ncbi:MAG: hypothetical protein HPY50_08540 [Firmicutes bacterium]|nr:hypothetical protein [Bacillota bacterium]
MNYRSTKLGVTLLLVAVFVLAAFAPAMAASCPTGSCGGAQYVCQNCEQGNGQCTCPDGQCACPSCDQDQNQSQCGPQGCGSPFANQFLQAGRYTGSFGNPGFGGPMMFGGGCGR